MAWTTPKTFAAAEVQTAAAWNTHLRDNLKWIDGGGGTSIMAGWQAYTPTWTAASVNPAIGNGTLAGTWMVIARNILFEARLTCGSTTTYGTGNYEWALPATITTVTRSIGGGFVVDTGTATHRVILLSSTSAKFLMFYGATTQTIASPTGPMTWANTDTMRLWGTVEAA